MTNTRGFAAVTAAVPMLSGIGAATAGESAGIESEAIPARPERHHSLDLGVGTLVGATSLSYEYTWASGHGLVLELHCLRMPHGKGSNLRPGGKEYAVSARLHDELLGEGPIALDGELSVGYSF